MVVGAGQSPGETMGNGRATSLLFAREGAMVVAVDRDVVSAEETVAMIHGEGGQAMAVEADVKDEESLKVAVDKCLRQHSRIDILHNNVAFPWPAEMLKLRISQSRRSIIALLSTCAEWYSPANMSYPACGKRARA